MLPDHDHRSSIEPAVSGLIEYFRELARVAAGQLPGRRSSGSFAGFDLGDGLECQRLAADTPQTFTDFIDFHPRHAAERFAFDGDHYVRDIGDDFLLLFRSEDLLQDFYVYEWHFVFLF
jgi:hypothetical protein